MKRLHTLMAAALLAVGAGTALAQGGGEALADELPSLRTPVDEAAAAPAALSREEVRESLHLARIGNRVTPSGEIGDTPEVLQAREDFNALQTEVLTAQAAEADAMPLITQQGTIDLDVLAMLVDRADREGTVTVLVIEPGE